MSGCGGSANPLIQAALGGETVNENCCAICGSAFRLTADLVQHMRNNHRRTRFKRKNEKSFLGSSWRTDH
ncbi:unnamed protein product [Angiostrongylus costaricensis]|uniref:C2H2-type domain-containing protein n=1 Tax=Angiostrongylus costaricensis TaxID=334426 RepID=A0A0R3Q261_ANGCS|nr:unnamed protein product [Angiostrongylus costaricensis]